MELPFLGSLAGSGKLARWVGGGEPEAADMREDGLRGNSGKWAFEGEGESARVGVLDPEGEGDEAKGLGGGDEGSMVS